METLEAIIISSAFLAVSFTFTEHVLKKPLKSFIKWYIKKEADKGETIFIDPI